MDRVAVVGLGYVGLPLACLLAESGCRTTGIDVDRSRLKIIMSGKSPIVGEEPGLPELIEKVVRDGSLVATDDITEISKVEAVFICVDTPVRNRKPDLTILKEVLQSVGKHIRKGQLVSVESTLPAKTCSTIVIPLLESNSGMKAGADFSLVHCPERVMPGKLLGNMRNVGRILGGIDAGSIKKGAYYYSKFVKADLHPTDLLSAEIAKTAENAYRDVQIAFANEMALLCEAVGGDVYEVRRLVNTCPYRDMHLPGSGVGGHCLPKDSWLLLSAAPEVDAKIMPAARDVNERMPHHMAEMAWNNIGKAAPGITKPRIAVMGLAFLKNSDDTRNSPAIPIIDDLADKADLVVHDPFVKAPYKVPMVRDAFEALKGADCAIFVTDHSVYQSLDLEKVKTAMRTPLIIDGRNIFSAPDVRAKGFAYAGIGKGRSA